MINEMDDLKRTIQTAFKLSGFVIRSDSAIFLAEQIYPFSSSEHEMWIDKIIEHVQNLKLSSNNIDRSQIELAVSKINLTAMEEGEYEFNLINAFDIPRFSYNNQHKKFYLDNQNQERNFLPKPNMKSKYLEDRYNILHQKTIRHELFAPPVQGSTSNVKKFKLYYVENLLSQSYISEVVVLGLLTQLTEGKFYIEDLTGVVPLDISKAQFHSGFFCEGSFILAEGKYQDEILTVTSIGFPPPELASSSRAYYGTQNTWGGDAVKLLKYSNNLAEIEKSNKEATIVFLSDVRLDFPQVLEKLKFLFIGYDECPPVAIVLMGPFFKSEKTIHQKRQLFDSLGDLVSSCERLKQMTELILVPSHEDPAAPNILPRPPIPESFVKGLQHKWGRIKLATNPCRLQYCTQQIVVCRSDLITKLCRNTIHFPNSGDLENHFARTLICQGTLCPVHPIAFPVYWEYDQALQLYPLPDLIVVGDPSESFSTTQLGCVIVNTGSFIKSKFTFKVYVPSTKTIEDSEIPDEIAE